MADTANAHGHGGDHHDEHDHVVPLWLLAGVFAALLVLTVVTVVVSEMELGDVALAVAMVVAVVKGSLVCLFFMHLIWDSLFNSIAVLSAIVFIGLFLGLAILDTDASKPQQAVYEASELTTRISASSAAPDAPTHGDHEGHGADPHPAPAHE